MDRISTIEEMKSALWSAPPMFLRGLVIMAERFPKETLTNIIAAARQLESEKERDYEGMKRILQHTAFALLLLPFLAGCVHSQVPQPTKGYEVDLTCTPPSDFQPGTGNGFVFSRAVCTSATSCPANTAGNTAFVALNATSPSATCSYLDATPPTGFVIYTASTVQNGATSEPSAPSNKGVPATIPALPSPPEAPSSTVQSAALAPTVQPAQPQKQMVVNKKLPTPTRLTAVASR